MNLLDHIHQTRVLSRRVDVLSRRLADVIPPQCDVLDVGCGDGLMAERIGQLRPDLSLQGIDVLLRDNCRIPSLEFDGRRLPLDDASVDVVMFVDVLHHTDDPAVLLAEANRVARRAIVIKDHTREGFLAETTLRFMDRVGNKRHGVALPFNYWRRRQWRDAFAAIGAEVERWDDDLRIYPWPARAVFDRSLHFVARLLPAPAASPRPTQPVEAPLAKL